VLTPLKRTTFQLNPYYDEIHKEFKNYWSNRGNWCKTMLRTETELVRQFLEYLQISSIADIREINVKLISEYLNYAKLRHPNGLNDVCASIRYLGDFFKGVGIEAPDLRLITPLTPTNRMLMPSFSDDEVMRILSAVNKTTDRGKRDYAILLLFAKLGLRAKDVANLKLTDIDWQKPGTELRFTQHKTGGDIILPLEDNVGNAIAEYILEARPKVDSPFVFITMRPPYRGLQSAALTELTYRYMDIAGIENRRGKGTHSFRRHLATKMLGAEVSYDKICEVLGHRQPHNLKSYIRIDSEGLSECGLDFTGIGAVSGVLK
jgi:integrase